MKGRNGWCLELAAVEGQPTNAGSSGVSKEAGPSAEGTCLCHKEESVAQRKKPRCSVPPEQQRQTAEGREEDRAPF